MTQTQTRTEAEAEAEAIRLDLADLWPTDASCPATQAALDAWLLTVLPTTPRLTEPTLALCDVFPAAHRPRLAVTRPTPSIAGAAAAATSLLGVGWMLVAALQTAAGA